MTITARPGPKEMNKMSDLFKYAFLYIIDGTCTTLLHMLKYIPGVQEKYDEAVPRNPYKLKLVPDHFKTQEMCEKAA